MATTQHMRALRQGANHWNLWRWANPFALPDLAGADLTGADLTGADLTGTDLTGTDLTGTDLTDANLTGTNLTEANLTGTNLTGADLTGADLTGAYLTGTNLTGTILTNVDLSGADLTRTNLTNVDLSGVNLTGAYLIGAHLLDANLTRTNLTGANLTRANLAGANLTGASLTSTNLSGTNLSGSKLIRAKLSGANLTDADLTEADLTGANLTGADLRRARLVRTNLEQAVLSKAWVYGIAVWDVKGTPADQRDLLITTGAPVVTIDDLKVAQFVYLILTNANIRDIIDTIGSKGVLILGRFGERKHVLDKLSNRLRELGFVPMVFDFERPVAKDFTETVRILAGLSAFIVADITSPKSVPQEAQAAIPDYAVPFVPIIEAGEEPWSMFSDLWGKYRAWVFEPLEYDSIDDLIPRLGPAVVQPALERREELLIRRAEIMGRRTLDEFDIDLTQRT